MSPLLNSVTWNVLAEAAWLNSRTAAQVSRQNCGLVFSQNHAPPPVVLELRSVQHGATRASSPLNAAAVGVNEVPRPVGVGIHRKPFEHATTLVIVAVPNEKVPIAPSDSVAMVSSPPGNAAPVVA